VTEHCCGPTPEQASRALSRGETLGTWERCPECAERERQLLGRIGFLPTKQLDWPPKTIHDLTTENP